MPLWFQCLRPAEQSRQPPSRDRNHLSIEIKQTQREETAAAMRASQFHLATSKETPASAELVSHQLMLRAGMIRQLAAGLYTWMPLGLRVLRNVERIVRDEMNRAGALELLMPMVQPAELWKQSDRWDRYGPELLRLTDRHQREFCLGPTHEEVITDLFRREIRSHRQLPINLYQIQTKFRDEIRPRFGVMRAREFVMKDAYSFHLDPRCLNETYERMVATYHRIFRRIGLNFRAVQADTGAIGGNLSHEFHVLADSGEDAIVFSNESDYAANIELAETRPGSPGRPRASQPMIVHSGAISGSVERAERVRLVVLRDSEDRPVALAVRGDHEINPIKLERLSLIRGPSQKASESDLLRWFGTPSPTPGELDCPVIADYAAASLADFAMPALDDNGYYTGVNWGRDLPEPQQADLRNVQAGDPSPDSKGTLQIARGIEVGHVFQLGTKYSEAMGARVSDESGNEVAVTMGCYGIGVSRVVAAAIEQNHDDRGIIWPAAIAPFQLALLPMQLYKSESVRKAAEQLYQELTEAGIDVLLDDRGLRPGVMFADMELIGIPHRLVISERGLESGTLEYQGRGDDEAVIMDRDEAIRMLKDRLIAAP